MHRKHTESIERHAYASGLRHGSPYLKTVFSASTLLACLILDKPAVSAFIILTMAAALVGVGGVRLRDYIGLLAIPLFFLVFGAVALLVTTYDAGTAAEVTLRALGAVSAFYFLILSTPVGEIMTVLRSCRLPKPFLALMYLIYRFIFILTDVWDAMNTAAQARLGYADYRASLHTFGGIAGNLLVLSMKRADAFYDAMEARCYDGELCFLETEKRSSVYEWIGAVFYLCVLVLIDRLT